MISISIAIIVSTTITIIIIITMSNSTDKCKNHWFSKKKKWESKMATSIEKCASQ